MPPPPKKRKKCGKRGTIHMIRLQNFMVYEDVRFYPGGKFNVLIGPNGTGKSSIVTAIVVGLGGDVKLMGRQDKLADLVRHDIGPDGKATITTEIYTGELDEDQKPKFEVIKCQFGSHMKFAEFSKNGRRVDHKEILNCFIKGCY